MDNSMRIEDWKPELSIEPTNICSARCSFCSYGKGGDWRKPGLISDDVFRRFVELVGKTSQQNVSLSTAHGDVLCHPNLFNMIEALNSKGKWVTFYTNASVLHRHELSRLLKCKIYQISVSTYLGNPDRYEQLFGVRDYGQVFTNILKLVSAPSRRFPVYMRMRCDKPFSKVKESDDFRLIQSFVGKKRITWLDEWDDFNGLVKDYDLPEGNHTFKPAILNRDKVCYGMVRKFKILKDGEIVTCNCRLSKDFVIGHIEDVNNVEDIRALPAWHKLINDWEEGRLPEMCKKCSHYQPYTDLANYSRWNIVKDKIRRWAK